MIRILSAADVRTAITMQEAIEAMRVGFIALSSGHARVPLRTHLQTPDGSNLFMPAYVDGMAFSAVKVVSIYPKNTTLPMISASVLVLDAVTGRARALMDGTYLTALRTGAGSGLATDLLARPDASVLGVIGAGAQARTQIEAVCAVRPIREVRVYSRSGAAGLVAALSPLYPAVQMLAVGSYAEALRGADILVAATTSSQPVITNADVKPGAHINGIGSYLPTMQEVAAEVVTRARIIVDSRESCLAEAGDLIIPIRAGLLRVESIHAEIGEVAAGLKSGRVNDQEVTFFKSVGNAVQDAVAAARILEAAEARGMGTLVEF